MYLTCSKKLTCSQLSPPHRTNRKIKEKNELREIFGFPRMVYSLSYSRGGRRGRRLPSPDMPLNSPKHPPYWNSASGFDFDLVTAVDMSFYTSLQNFIYIGPPSAEKMTSCRFSRWRISAILDFRGPVMGSLRSPCTTSYRSSIETITLNCLVFEKIAFSAFWRQTDRQTDRLTN